MDENDCQPTPGTSPAASSMQNSSHLISFPVPLVPPAIEYIQQSFQALDDNGESRTVVNDGRSFVLRGTQAAALEFVRHLRRILESDVLSNFDQGQESTHLEQRAVESGLDQSDRSADAKQSKSGAETLMLVDHLCLPSESSTQASKVTLRSWSELSSILPETSHLLDTIEVTPTLVSTLLIAVLLDQQGRLQTKAPVARPLSHSDVLWSEDLCESLSQPRSTRAPSDHPVEAWLEDTATATAMESQQGTSEAQRTDAQLIATNHQQPAIAAPHGHGRVLRDAASLTQHGLSLQQLGKLAISEGVTPVPSSTQIGKAASKRDSRKRDVTIRPDILQRLRDALHGHTHARLELMIGKLFIDPSSVPKKSRRRLWADDPWSLQPGELEMQCKFAPKLTSRSLRAEGLLDVKLSGSRSMFSAIPLGRSTRYEVTCESRGEDQICVHINEHGSHHSRSLDTMMSVVNLHFPRNFWDGRMTIHTPSNTPPTLTDTNAIRRSFKVHPLSPTEASVSLLCSDPAIASVKGVAIRETYHHCNQYPDLMLRLTESRDLGLKKSADSNTYHGAIRTARYMAAKGKLWWTAAIIPSKGSRDDLNEGNLKALNEMLSLAYDLVPRIDHVGAT